MSSVDTLDQWIGVESQFFDPFILLCVTSPILFISSIQLMATATLIIFPKTKTLSNKQKNSNCNSYYRSISLSFSSISSFSHFLIDCNWLIDWSIDWSIDWIENKVTFTTTTNTTTKYNYNYSCNMIRNDYLLFTT